MLAAPHKRIHSPLSWAPRHKPSKWKGQRDGGTCSSPERVNCFRWSRSHKSAFKDHFCCIHGKEKPSPWFGSKDVATELKPSHKELLSHLGARALEVPHP